MPNSSSNAITSSNRIQAICAQIIDKSSRFRQTLSSSNAKVFQNDFLNAISYVTHFCIPRYYRLKTFGLLPYPSGLENCGLVQLFPKKVGVRNTLFPC